MTDQPEQVADALAEVARLGAQAAALNADAGAALVPAGPGMPAEQAREIMISARRVAAAKAGELEAARKRVKDLIDAQRRDLEAQLAAASAMLAPLKETAARLEEGIWSFSLYLGAGESIVQLADGEPAPEGTPVHVRQGVLAMDEETAINAESGGIDFRDVTTFDEWITSDPGHLDQLLPEARGVVAIMPRRSEKEYGDIATNMVANQANKQTYLLIRNGGALYRYVADGFEAGRRLVPLRDEFTSLFTTTRWNPSTRQDETVRLEPGGFGWEAAEKAAGRRERHYMRVALILQGLLDRTAVFAPLPAQGMSLLHPYSYEAGHIVLIADEENALGSGRPPFHKWLAAKMAALRPGMRIAGNFAGQTWSYANDCRDGNDRPRWGEHSRVHPTTASHPQTGTIYTIERREGRDLVFLYDRTDEVLRRNVPVPDEPGWHYRGLTPVPARQRASARIRPEDTFAIPLDLVTADECRTYLAARTERRHYADMFPVLKAVIAAKEAEAAAEAPMRLLLAGHIAAQAGVTVEEATAAVPALVDWWKLANRWHRPLVTGGDPAAEAKAVTAITREFAARRADNARDAGTPARMLAVVPAAILAARKRDGTWLALEPQPSAIPGQPAGVWLREHTWTKTMAGHRTRDWVMPEPAQVARWRILWSAPAWEARDHAASPAGHLTDPELAHVIDTALIEAGRQAAATRDGRHRDTTAPPLGGEPVAVIATGHRVTVFWSAAAGDDADGVTGARMTTTWKRSTGGRVALTHGHLYAERWSSTPWPDGTGLAWSHNAAIAAVTLRLEAADAAAKASQELWRKARRLQAAIADAWTVQAREAARVKFIDAYADESLWEEHSAGQRFDFPHTGPRGWEKPWEKAVERLTDAGADLAGLTVAQMAALDAAATGETVPVPDDIAQLRFPGQEDDE